MSFSSSAWAPSSTRRRRRSRRRRGLSAHTAPPTSPTTADVALRWSPWPAPSPRPSLGRPGPRTRCTSCPARRLNSQIETLNACPPLLLLRPIKPSGWDLSQGRWLYSARLPPEVGSRSGIIGTSGHVALWRHRGIWQCRHNDRA